MVTWVLVSARKRRREPIDTLSAVSSLLSSVASGVKCPYTACCAAVAPPTPQETNEKQFKLLKFKGCETQKDQKQKKNQKVHKIIKTQQQQQVRKVQGENASVYRVRDPNKESNY